MKEKIVGVFFALSFVGAIWFVISYGLWKLWTWIIPQFFPSGNESVIRPSFWLFVGAWFLVSMIGKSIFGSKEKQ